MKVRKPPGIPDILAEIVAHEQGRVEEARKTLSVDQLRESPLYGAPRRGLARALAQQSPAVIAECKRRSPSKGILRDPYDPQAIARSYAEAGASAISVLTNQKFFGGCLEDLGGVRGAVELPLLRKDFVVDPYQLHEALAFGADAILLIVAVHDSSSLLDLYHRARDLDLDVLVEVHDEAELEAALLCEDAVLGVNNRDLRTFETDLSTCEKIRKLVSADKALVAESGLRDGRDLARLRKSGIHAFLVGEAFMKADQPGTALAEMIRGANP